MDLNQKLNNLEFKPADEVWTSIESKNRQEAEFIHHMSITPPAICWIKIAEQICVSENNIEKEKPQARIIFSKWLRYAAVAIGITLGSIGLFNTSIRNRLYNTLLEGNLKTSLSDSQQISNSKQKKPDTSIKIKTVTPLLPTKKN